MRIARYTASKQEVESWAIEEGHKVEYPRGVEGEYVEQAFMVLRKK